jgi:hypothetical protein
LTALASEIIAKAGVEDGDALRKARTLEAHFANLGLYKYSLDPSPNRNYDEDPVEDFVSNHRTGHCQFFASALTLMLRSQGIPARIVVGYHGGVYNAVGNYYQIRELDAHAWVEAMVSNDEIPDDEVLPMEGFDVDEAGDRPNAWLRLDPTPSGLAAYDPASISVWRTKLDDAVDYVQLLWSEYVLGLNQKRQQKAIYDPIRRAFGSAFDYLLSAERWAVRFQMLRDRFRGNVFTRRNVRDMVVAVAVLTAAFYILQFFTRFARRVIIRWWNRQRKHRRPPIEFYRRFETLLSRHGVARKPHQTPREYAHLAGDALERTWGLTAESKIPMQVVDAFYGVRFGARRLDNDEVQRLESSLQELQRALAAGSRGAPKSNRRRGPLESEAR